jgi:predicted nicotinamide N-methyase
MAASSSRAALLAATVEAAPTLVPELRLRLVTPACALWRARPEEAAALGFVDPYWAFCWPGGQAVARHVLDRPDLARGRSVLDFGAGGGVVALAAAKAGAARVLAADIDPAACEAAALNAALNAVALDVTDDDLVGRDDGWDVVLAGDVTYEPALARRVVAWLQALARRGALVLVGDPGRHAMPPDFAAEARYVAPSDVDGTGPLRRPTTVWRVTPPRGSAP